MLYIVLGDSDVINQVMEQQLDAKIRALQAQLEGLSDGEEEKQEKEVMGPGYRLSQNLEALQNQLMGMPDEEGEANQSKVRETKKLSTIPSPIKKIEQKPESANKSLTLSKKQSASKEAASKAKDRQVFVMPAVEDISTLMAMEELIALAEQRNDRMYLDEVVARKIKLFGFISSGKLNSASYTNSLRNKNLNEIRHPFLREAVIKEQNLLKKYSSQEEYFSKIVKKYKQSLAQQCEMTGASIEPKPYKSKSAFVPKAIKPTKQQLNLIEGINKAPTEKKLELLLQSMAKINCLIEYYQTHLLEKKRAEVEKELLPAMEYAQKLVTLLRSKKAAPIGEFYALYMPKVTFELFHGFKNKKQFPGGVSLVIQKFKHLLNVEKDFKKLISKNQKNTLQVEKVNKQIATYEEDLKYLGDIKMKSFVPLPNFKVYSEEREYFTENTKLQHNDLQLIIKQVEGFGSAELKIYFDESSNPKSTYHINSGNQDIQVMIKMTQEAVNDLPNKSIRLKMQTKSMLLFTKDLMTGNIDLSQLQSKNTFEGVLFANGIKIVYQVNVRLPTNKISTIKIEVIRLKRLPEYECTPQYQRQYMKNVLFPNSKTQNPPPAQTQPPPKSTPTSTKPQQPQQPPPPPKQKLSLTFALRSQQVVQKLKTTMPGFPPDLLERPQIYCESLNYQAAFDPILDSVMNQIHQYKPNRKIAENIQEELMTRKSKIQARINAGKLDEEGYIKILEASQKTDSVLIQIYSKLQLPEFVKFLGERLQIVREELKAVKGEEEAPQKQEQKPVPPQQTNPKPQPKQQPVPPNQQPAPPNQPKLLDLSGFKLSFVRRSPQVQEILDSITQPIDFIEPQKIKKPETLSVSLKYLTDFDHVLDQALNLYAVGDKPTKKMVEDVQDEILKLSFQIKKKKQSLAPQQYNQLVQTSIESDMKLRRIYKQLKLKDFENFILARIKICKEEIGKPLVLEEDAPLSFNPNQEVELFQLKGSPQATESLSKYPQSIQSPQLPQACSCVSYIQRMIQLTTNPDFKAKLEKVKADFQNSMNEGTFDQDEYVKKLKNARQEDILRLDLYRKLNLKDHYFFVKARIKIMDEELSNF